MSRSRARRLLSMQNILKTWVAISGLQDCPVFLEYLIHTEEKFVIDILRDFFGYVLVKECSLIVIINLLKIIKIY